MKCMVVKNQEARDALEMYIKNFDITNFPGENVPIACLWIKAVATALGDDDLPTICSPMILMMSIEDATTNDAIDAQADDTHDVNTDNEDIASFLSMVGGSLKD